MSGNLTTGGNLILQNDIVNSLSYRTYVHVCIFHTKIIQSGYIPTNVCEVLLLRSHFTVSHWHTVRTNSKGRRLPLADLVTLVFIRQCGLFFVKAISFTHHIPPNESVSDNCVSKHVVLSHKKEAFHEISRLYRWSAVSVYIASVNHK